jgi:hypothetical protein
MRAMQRKAELFVRTATEEEFQDRLRFELQVLSKLRFMGMGIDPNG